MFQHDEPGEGTPGSEAWLKLVGTDLLVAGFTEAARSTTTDEGSSYPVAGFPVDHPVADLLDDTSEFVTGNVGEMDLGIMAHPAVPVAPAHSGGFDPNDDPGWSWDRIWNGFDRQLALEFPEEGSLHGIEGRE
jgi:hypothetical protein|tara:strand:- start:6476 stop:6874 length:399 start_codon:yes stop_codon:yes gene_type:complete